MTRFEKDLQDVKNGKCETAVLKERRKEIESFEKELKFCRNSFRAKCIMQDLEKRIKEYEILDSYI